MFKSLPNWQALFVPLSVIPRSEATWESVSQKKTDCHGLRPRNDTQKGAPNRVLPYIIVYYIFSSALATTK